MGDVKETLIVKELRAEKFGVAATPSAPETGWAVTNKTSDRTLDCNVNNTLVTSDVLGTLIDDLIAKGIISA